MRKQDLRGFWKDQEVPAKEPTPEKPKRPKKAKKRKKGRRPPTQEQRQKLAAAGVTGTGAPHPDYVSGDSKFYSSSAWKTLRYAVLVKCGGRCQCCGASASDGEVLQVDHIEPRWKAPHRSLDIDNLQVLCSMCNSGKGAWDMTDWRNHFRSI